MKRGATLKQLSEENIQKIAEELTNKIMVLLMKKTINEVTFNIYKPKIYQLILDSLKSNS